jgi:hypothetical protein
MRNAALLSTPTNASKYSGDVDIFMNHKAGSRDPFQKSFRRWDNHLAWTKVCHLITP